VNGIVPPVADAVDPPSAKPLHVMFESTTLAATNITGSVTDEELVEVHPLASVIVVVYVPATIPVIEAVVAVLLQAYVYGIVPPVADALAPPLAKPLQVMFESTALTATKIIGSVIVEELVELHPFASVIVVVYVPATTPVIEAVVAELIHAYVYGIVPPVADAVAPPSARPLQDIFESTTVAAIIEAGSVMVELLVEVHPFASVMVTL
jgi:hypothetical protein